jgi:hypothetical protein
MQKLKNKYSFDLYIVYFVGKDTSEILVIEVQIHLYTIMMFSAWRRDVW